MTENLYKTSTKTCYHRSQVIIEPIKRYGELDPIVSIMKTAHGLI